MALKLQEYVLDSALETIQVKGKGVRDTAATIKAQIDAGPIASDIIINLMRHMRTAYDIISAAKVTPGLNAYAQNEFDDPAYDYGRDQFSDAQRHLEHRRLLGHHRRIDCREYLDLLGADREQGHQHRRCSFVRCRIGHVPDRQLRSQHPLRRVA